MIVNAAGTLALSSFRWVDQGNLWSYSLGESEPKQNHLSDAKWLSLIQGSEDYFAVVHHFEDGRVRLTSHSFRNISEATSSIDLQIADINSIDVEVTASRFTGEGPAWSFLPRAYIVRPFEEACLVLISWDQKTAQVRSLSWYKGSYDPMYQGIRDVTEMPGSSLLIFSIQRDSKPVLFDPMTNKVVQRLSLADRSGNPQLYFRRTAPELWASDYDTVVKLDSRSWDVLNRLKLQDGRDGMERLFIGEYCFNKDESLCLVARPYSGDVLGIDPRNSAIVRRAETQGQPLEVGIFRDNRMIARDWKTGHPLQGTLQPI